MGEIRYEYITGMQFMHLDFIPTKVSEYKRLVADINTALPAGSNVCAIVPRNKRSVHKLVRRYMAVLLEYPEFIVYST